MFIKNSAKIRDKLAGNGRHLQNKGRPCRGGSVQSDQAKRLGSWTGLHPFIGGGGGGVKKKNKKKKKRGFGMLRK